MKMWKIASSIAAGAVIISVIILSYSIPVNPCGLAPTQKADALQVSTTTKERYDSAELVVLGRITDSKAKCEGTQIWTHMQVQVEEYLKNPQETDTLSVKSIGGAIGDYGYGLEDSPIYSKGDRVLLFLNKENPEDKIYRISSYTGVIQEQGVTGRELLKGFALKASPNDTITAVRGTDATAILSLESFFGYDSPTNVTISSFTYYNSTTQDSFNTANVTALSEFGLSVEPAYAVITPPVNGTALKEFKISVSDSAIPGVYDISFSATENDRYSYSTPSSGFTFSRVNVTHHGDEIISTMPPLPYGNAISINIEGYGRRAFYQDEHAGLPANLTISDASAFDPGTTISWPSIGPNYILTRSGNVSNHSIVFDYYKSLGISDDMVGLQFDEFIKRGDLSPPPAIFGRAFGFDWNQTSLEGTRADPGTYTAFLTIPVMIEDKENNKKIITLTSSSDAFTIIEGTPVPRTHNLILEYNVNDTSLFTGDPYSFSLYLVNDGNHSESFTVDHNSEEGSCYWKHTLRLEQPDHKLPPGGRVNLASENNIGGAPRSPGLYPYTPFVMLSIDEPERVECLKVQANSVTLNVTAPVYEGIKLAITTDKQVYQRNESVPIDLYIENNSDQPFKLQEFVPSISIRDDSGREVYGMIWVADYSTYPTVEPHFHYRLTSTVPLNWDQRVYLEDGSTLPAQPGEYFIEATFTYPYLESDVHKIIIE